MFPRLRLDPTPTEGGGGAPAPTPAQQQQPAMIQVTPDQFKSYLDTQNELAAIKATQAQREAEAAAEHQKVLVEKGQIQQAWDAYKGQLEPKLKAESEKAERYRQKLHAEALGKVVAESFAGVTFASDSAKLQAMRHAASLLETAEDAEGNVLPRQPGTGIDAREFLKAQIHGPEFAHFLAPSSRGGSGATNPPPPGQGQQQPFGRNPFEAAMAQAHIKQTQSGSGIPGFGRLGAIKN